MEHKATGMGLGVAGLVLGIVGTVASTVAVALAGAAMHKAHKAKQFNVEDMYK